MANGSRSDQYTTNNACYNQPKHTTERLRPLQFSLLLLFGDFGREFLCTNSTIIIQPNSRTNATIHKEPLTQTMFQTQLNFDQKSTGEAIYIQRNKFERRTHNAMYQTETEMARLRTNGSGKRTKSNVRLYCEL